MWLLVYYASPYYYSAMPIYDLTVAISSGLPTYPGDPGIQIDDWSRLADGASANVTGLHLGAHTGTNVDAPAHSIEGAKKVELLSRDVLICEAGVIEVPPDRLTIDEQFVAETVKTGMTRVLFKTRNSAFWTGDNTDPART